MGVDDEQRQLSAVRNEALREFGDRLPADVVLSRFADIVSRFDGAPVRTFVPVLTRRALREELGSV
jgi:hypothetical protein